PTDDRAGGQHGRVVAVGEPVRGEAHGSALVERRTPLHGRGVYLPWDLARRLGQDSRVPFEHRRGVPSRDDDRGDAGAGARHRGTGELLPTSWRAVETLGEPMAERAHGPADAAADHEPATESQLRPRRT